MASKILYLFLLAVASQVQGIPNIWLDDRSLTYHTNDLLGVGISIPKSFLDTLEVCTVIFPNGVTYEAYPNSNLPSSVSFGSSVQPFTACNIEFRGVPVEMSGTYQLNSLVLHSSNSSHTMTRQRFLLTILEFDPWQADAN